MNKKNMPDLIKNKKWKNMNSNYLKELQKTLDLIDNIEDKKLKQTIIKQLMKYDTCLTEIAEEIFALMINKN